MALLFVSEFDSADRWREALNAERPGLPVHVHPEPYDPSDIRYALVWRPPAGLLAGLPKLEVIFSIGAGVDGILTDTAVPRDKPLVRMVSDGLKAEMVEYVVCHVLRWHCQVDLQADQQRRREWKRRRRKPHAETVVGILGLGVLGRAAAHALASFGFSVRGWSRGQKRIDGIDCFSGAESFSAFLADCDIVVCLLPLTPETDGILNERMFDQLPRGAYLINAARGGHLIDGDLILALDSGSLSGATLDVFRTEPLPEDHPFWGHPAITITPHDASMTPVRSGAKHVARQIERYENGRPLEHLVDFSRGY